MGPINAAGVSWRLADPHQAKPRSEFPLTSSLGPGSLVGKRTKNIGERSNPSAVPGEGEGGTVLAALFPTKEPGPRLSTILRGRCRLQSSEEHSSDQNQHLFAVFQYRIVIHEHST